MTSEKAAKLAQLGFSIIPCSSKKIPIGEWKKYQESPRAPEEVKKLSSVKFGIVAGYNDLEVIDVDLKVFSTTTEKTDFWGSLLELFRESIYDFDEKFTIAKTENQGFHILYQSKRVQGNQKLAVLEGHTEAIIETRGKGGMVIAYDKFFSDLTYRDVRYITDTDRKSLMRICRSFNYIEEKKKPTPKKNKLKFHDDNSLRPGDDFNQQNDVWDVISDEFEIVKDSTDKTLIKRHGAKSFHSGYIFKKNNLMYLFSTGTIYPHEEALTPFACFAHKFHAGDFSAAAKDLYNQGFGDRYEKEIKEKEEKIPDNTKIINDYVYNKKDANFPIEIFPKPFQSYMIECRDKLNSVLDYLGCALLWSVSLMCGNRFSIEVKRGWEEKPIVWMALVGAPGIGKTPSINRILKPLMKENNRRIKEYILKREEFDKYDALSKKEKEEQIQVDAPTKKQFIADDITLEALIDLHECVPTGIGVYKDELAGWLKDMNKYREGSDLEFWLSTWSGSSVSVNRITRRGSFVESPFIPVLGGIQPAVLNDLYTQEKKDNGFMDRMLIAYPDVEIPKYSEEEVSYESIDWYFSSIINIKRRIDKLCAEYFTEFPDHKEIICRFSPEAKRGWIDKFNDITDKQNAITENEYFKTMYPKQKSYIPRFAFLLNVLNSFFDEKVSLDIISEKSMRDAAKLSDYFVETAKKIKIENKEAEDIRHSMDNRFISNYDKIRSAYAINPDFNKSKMADLLGISRQTVYNYLSEIRKNEDDKDR